MQQENGWENYQVELKNFIRSKINDTDSAKDILQELYIIYHTKGESVRDQLKIKQWLFQVCRNLIVMTFRKTAKDRVVEIMEELATISENKNALAEKCLKSSFEKLPERYKKTLELVELNNQSQKDVARFLGISYSGAKSRLQRGKILLKKYMEQCCKIERDPYGNVLSLTPKIPCNCSVG